MRWRSRRPARLTSDRLEYQCTGGRIVAGVEIRICDDDGLELPRDGEAVGEFEVRGPWITGSYYASDDPEKFHDGWLRTGDVGSLDAVGFMRISDRTKDVIKSGRGVDQLGRARERGDGTSRGLRGRRGRDPRRALAGASARLRRGRARAQRPRRLRSSSSSSSRRSRSGGCPTPGRSSSRSPRPRSGKFDKKVLRSQFAKGELTVVNFDHHRA